jgi:hypothetical protein
MKRLVILVALALLLVTPAFSQVRFDLGFDVPLTVGTITGSGVTTSSEVGTFLQSYHFPFPEASISYQFGAGPVILAPGLRVFTVILETVAWPNLLAELRLGPIFIDAQVGGLLFGYFGVVNGFDYGKVIMPDLSVWFGFGKERRFRVGAGVLGFVLPELTMEGMLIVPYAGLKIALEVK